ncbi:MAG TPA: glycosyltransferase [Xanthobacteraceae bacterium]|nr:glycosyltransferase [Xanthobacteraceae bacterium]
MAPLIIAAIVLATWLYLIAARGGFWRAAEGDNDGAPPAVLSPIPGWPPVTAVVPARDEAETVGETIASLFRQDYGGPFNVILVDDQSRDATTRVAREAAAALGAGDRLHVIAGRPPPAGWTGKLWAQNQGVESAVQTPSPLDYLLLTDADIVFAPGALASLVARTEKQRLVLNSLMVKLRCKSFAERMFVPAFVFFFQMLYPFAWVNEPRRATAAAAGGCMLVKRETLQAAGGLAAIRGALIDDCALAKLLKSRGPIALALTDNAHSLRAYPSIGDIRHMVARTAYAQLGYSPFLLAGVVFGLALTYLAPVALTLFADGFAQFAGLFAWALMANAFRPILRFYGMSGLRSWLWAAALPAIAAMYMAFTLDSAYQHARGRGGMWKGRAQANI